MELHPYSYSNGSQTDERVSVSFRLAICSLVVSGTLYYFWSTIGLGGKDNDLLGFIISAPTALAFSGFFYRLTCDYLWKNHWARKSLLLDITVPNLNGTWVGQCRTYYPDGKSYLREVRLVIWQDMRHIGICIDTPLHKIDSLGASIRRAADGWIVHFHYLALRKLKKQEHLPVEEWRANPIELEQGANEEDLFKRDSLGHHTHTGCARLYHADPDRWPEGNDPSTIKLQFFTDNRRYGFMELTRKNTKAFPVIAKQGAEPKGQVTPPK